MFCPDCGEICDGRGLCPACEQQARERAVRNGPVGLYRIGGGKRRALDGSLDISRRHLVIRKKTAGMDIKSVIEYRDIEQMVFCRAVGDARGFLALRKRGNVFPIVGSLWEAERSPMALTFTWRHSGRFEEASIFLERVINAHRALAVRAGHPHRSGRKYCPVCGSRDIFNPMLPGTVFHATAYYIPTNLLACRVCTYQWYAGRSDEVIRPVIE